MPRCYNRLKKKGRTVRLSTKTKDHHAVILRFCGPDGTRTGSLLCFRYNELWGWPFRGDRIATWGKSWGEDRDLPGLSVGLFRSSLGTWEVFIQL